MTRPANKAPLLLSVLFLGVSSIAMMANELAFHFFQSGMMKDTFNKIPGATIGFFEAHGLAFLWVVFLYREMKKGRITDLNIYAALVHALLGFANTLFWKDAIVRFDMLTAGIITTILHYLLTLIHLFVYIKQTPKADREQAPKTTADMGIKK
ncbi:MAG: hypothetical protein JNL57_04530 [Bacteroidetes bacterium]|nr:hypothetical protein [Bacteroidota bacterium]